MTRSWLNSLLLGGLLACLSVSGARAAEVQLKFVKLPEFDRTAPNHEFPLTMSFLGGSPESFKKPAGEWKLPRLVSAYPIYYLMPFGEEKRLLVFDQKDANDNYTRLYFDANGNRDLTDDPPIEGVYEKKNGLLIAHGVEFPVIELTLKIGGKDQPYAFQPMLGSIDEWKKRHQSVMVGRGTTCCYAGECELEGKRMRIALLDNNFNGRFDEFCSTEAGGPDPESQINTRGDRIMIVPAGNPNHGSNDTTLCNRIGYDSKVYDVAVDLAAGKLTLNETRDKLANIRIPKGLEYLTLLGDGGDRSFSVIRPAATLTIPDGRYRLLFYSGKISDDQGNPWNIMAYATGKTLLTVADPQSENPLRIGAPFTAVARVSSAAIENVRRSPNPAQVDVNFAILDAAGRQISNLNCLAPKPGFFGMKKEAFERSAKNPASPREPAYRILDGTGKEVASGTFEYG